MAIEVFLRGENQTGIFCEKKAAQPLFNWNRLFNPRHFSPFRDCVSAAQFGRDLDFQFQTISIRFYKFETVSGKSSIRERFEYVWKMKLSAGQFHCQVDLDFQFQTFQFNLRKSKLLAAKIVMGLKKCNCQQRNLTVARMTLIFSSRKVDCRLFPCNFVWPTMSLRFFGLDCNRPLKIRVHMN